MRWLRRLIREWLTEADVAIAEPNRTRIDSNPQINVSLREATNGYVLEMSQFKPQKHGSDWEHTFYVLKHGEDVAAAVAVLLVQAKLSR